MINDFKIMRLKKVKPSTCRTQLAFMSRFYRFAKHGLLINIHNPVSDIALPKPDRSSDKVVRASELERLLAKLSPTRGALGSGRALLTLAESWCAARNNSYRCKLSRRLTANAQVNGFRELSTVLTLNRQKIKLRVRSCQLAAIFTGCCC